jgi:hypothetical protein
VSAAGIGKVKDDVWFSRSLFGAHEFLLRVR